MEQREGECIRILNRDARNLHFWQNLHSLSVGKLSECKIALANALGGGGLLDCDF